MKRLLLTTIVALTATLAATGAQAQDKQPGTGVNPYTHCGIGAALFPDTHWAAVTSNVIWDLGTTAITSAVASPETCSAKKMETATVIIETLPELEKDIAMGEGSYVVALADTMGCSAQQAEVIGSMRTSYKDVLADESYAKGSDIDRATGMYNAARDAAISAGCGATL